MWEAVADDDDGGVGGVTITTHQLFCWVKAAQNLIKIVIIFRRYHVIYSLISVLCRCNCNPLITPIQKRSAAPSWLGCGREGNYHQYLFNFS